MRKFLIVSHGQFAGGIKSALELIMGPAPEVIVLQAYVEENRSVEEEIAGMLRSAGKEVEWVVLTDLLGGSITNQVLRVAADLGVTESVHIVAGMNLPLVIEVVMSDPETPVQEVLTEAVGLARQQLAYVNDLMNNNG
jgi:fructoselysine and glucoselysine-specific PTS system IIA component